MWGRVSDPATPSNARLLGFHRDRRATLNRTTGGSCPYLGCDCGSIASEGWMVGAVGFEPTTSTV